MTPTPTPHEILAAREASGLTQTQAAEVLGYTLSTWQKWEAGTRTMRRVLLDIFRLETRAAENSN